jgi:hypothetical protein
MPGKSVYGDHMTGPAPESKTAANPTAKQAFPPIEIDRFCRNGQHTHASLQNQLNSATNAAVLYRSKEVFSGGDWVLSGSAITSFGAGDRARWRFAFRTGAYSHAVYCVVIMAQPTSGLTNNTEGRLDIATSTTGSPAVQSAEFIYGNGGSASGWPTLRVCKILIGGITADTEYYGTFYDVDYGRIQSACVFDLQSATENNNGYLAQNTTTHTPVLNLHRQNIAEISNALWQKGGAHVLNYSVNDGTAPNTLASATDTNVIDGTSTAISANTPGYTLDMTGKDRLSQTSGVPCVMKAFIKSSIDGATARVRLKDSGGTTLATCSTTSTTAGWVSTTFNLPATSAKYDLMMSATGGATVSLYAASVYEYG